MKKIFLSGIVCLFFIARIVAQNNLPPVYEIKSDTAYQQELSQNYYQVLDDKAGNWTIDQVIKPPISHQFRDRNFMPQGVDTSVSTYWFRYILKNTTDHDISIALDAYGDKADFYLFDSTAKFTHYLTGWGVPWSKKNGIKVNNTIPIKMNVNEKFIIYNRIYNKEPGIVAGLKIGILNNEKNLIKQFIKNQDDYYQATSYFHVLLTGFLLVAALFNFFFFLTVKEKMYLYFSLFLITLSFVSSEFITEVLAREHYQISQILDVFNSSVMLFFLLYFIRHYFQTFVFTKRWDNYLIVIGFVWLIYSSIIFLFPVFPRPFKNGGLILLIIIIISAFVTLFKFKRLHHSNVKAFVIAVFPFLIIVATVLFMSLFFLITKAESRPTWMEVFANVGIFTAIFWMVAFFSWTLFRRYDSQSKALSKQALELERIAREKEEERSRLIELQKVELEKQVQERTAELNSSLQNLKSTQSQLIQAEKMASLGELTAGIAHEIQNPLNFVNNFSEVNKELITELVEEVDKGNTEAVKTIANDIKENSEKINHHGKRADAIVKGMLQHSQSSIGQKEPTDINSLCDEYLRLSYHGLRAKDKSFNATIKTDFDESIGKINIIPQDIGRVILNLLTNAFYAVDEKRKAAPPPPNLSAAVEGGIANPQNDYEPTVIVKTSQNPPSGGRGAEVVISVSDNGNGIPQKVLEKIFQPFFTTKPTGQGTGLGLSLSYDIIKSHGGEIKIETKVDEGRPDNFRKGKETTFIIQLPVV